MILGPAFKWKFLTVFLGMFFTGPKFRSPISGLKEKIFLNFLTLIAQFPTKKFIAISVFSPGEPEHAHFSRFAQKPVKTIWKAMET